MSRERYAFVAGATGYVGRSVVEHLVARGIPTLAHVRPDSSSRAIWTARFLELGAEVDATPWEDAAMAQTLETHHVAWAFALLGTTKKRAQALGWSASEGYERVDYGLTHLLLEAAGQLQHPPRFVYLSAAGVQPSTRNPYMQARARIEAELRASSVPFVIVRPAFISGDDRDESRPAERLGARVFDGLLRVGAVFGADRLHARYRSRSASDLASSLVDVALDPSAAGATLLGDDLDARRNVATHST